MSPKIDDTKEVAKKEESGLALPSKYFEDNANVGLSGLDVDDVPIPTLSVVQSGSKFRDSEDRPFTPGKLYYKALKEAFSVVEATILVIMKKNLPSYTNKDEFERTYVFMGCMQPTKMPFIMYNKSSSYFSARQFIGEVKARKYPMYTLKVQISTEKRQNDMGEWFVPVFSIVGVQTDPDEILMLENLAKEYDMNQDVIRSEEEEAVKRQKVEAEIPEEVMTGETVHPDEIPF